MQKEKVRNSKLRKLRNFEILIRNLRKKYSHKEKFITRSNLNILNSNFSRSTLLRSEDLL